MEAPDRRTHHFFSFFLVIDLLTACGCWFLNLLIILLLSLKFEFSSPSILEVAHVTSIQLLQIPES